jgi:hypothetical protein
MLTSTKLYVSVKEKRKGKTPEVGKALLMQVAGSHFVITVNCINMQLVPIYSSSA